MARKVHRLSAKKVASNLEPGYYSDGGGLYMQVGPSGSKSWIFRFMRHTVSSNGKPMSRDMGLGSLLGLSLAEAREKAADCRRLLANRIDPIDARDSVRARQALEAAKSMAFTECAAAFIKANRAGWKNEKHIAQWENTIATYAQPVFGSLSVQAVDTGLVLKALEPIWTEKPETATRLRARIERVLDWATARGYRTGDNPARWRGHMDKLLPKLEKRRRVKHLAALPFAEMGTFMTALRTHQGVAARALEFLILTATRTSEVICARWSEIDMEGAVWNIPAERMKAHRAHRVPLSPQAVKLLRSMEALRRGDFVFPGPREGKPLSDMAMLVLLERMERDDITVHGFRSTFRDWASECTNYPREVCEMALAHAVSDQVEAAYRRGDLVEKRRRLMSEWAKYCDNTKALGEVVALKSKGTRSHAAR